MTGHRSSDSLRTGDLMRRRPAHAVTVVALAALAAGGLCACSAIGQKSFEDDAQVPQKVTSVRLDNSDGGVKVGTSAGVSTVTVHRRVSYRGDKPKGTSVRVVDGVLTLSGCGSHCGIDYVVTVPAALPVSGGTSNGGLTLTGMSAVDVHTSNGRITVDGASGPVKLLTSNGEVRVKGTRGGVDARTSNGGVTIETATPQNIRARTTNGSLSVTAPPAKYQVRADSSHGERKVAFANDPSATYRLDLSTTNGDLTVKQAG
nr:hypothetical protein StreXyl84_69920 [Streptomyces sp. Xyl84]